MQTCFSSDDPEYLPIPARLSCTSGTNSEPARSGGFIPIAVMSKVNFLSALA